MAKFIREESVPLPVENRLRDGLTIRYLEISKFELCLRWTFSFIFSDTHTLTWKRVKELASKGRLRHKVYAGACAHPLWTNIYQLK